MRCDAGAQHGLGHLSRCLTLARELRRRGATVEFWVSASAAILARVREQGFAVNYVADVGAADRLEWLEMAADLLIIDSKAADADYVATCQDRVPGVVFDDELARDLPCSVIINNNVWAAAADYPPRAGRKLLLGTEYNTVDPRYFDLAGTVRQGLLISMGGEDPGNHTAWLIETLAPHLPAMPVYVCIGPAHPDPDAVSEAAARHLPQAEIHRAPASLLDLVVRSSAALSAGGTTCYELAAAGVPTAILSVEDHQDRMRAAMCAAGAAVSLGRFDTIAHASAVQALERLLEPEEAARLAQAAKRLVPAPGVPSIVNALTTVLGVTAG